MPEEKEESSSNIDVLWLKSIYEDLRDLEQHIILSKTGFQGMEEMFSLQTGDKTEIQLRNLKVTIIKFLNILDNVQTRVPDKFFKETKETLKLFEKGISLESTGVIKPIHYKIIRSDPQHLAWKELTDKFHKTLNIIDNLKSELIKELDPILYFIQEGDTLDKTKQRKKIR